MVGLVEFDLFGPGRDEPVLKVDPLERRGQFAQIGCGCADQAAKLAERPVGWSNGSFLAGDDEREAFGPVAARLDADFLAIDDACGGRSEEHTSELQSLMRISYAVFCLKKKNIVTTAT